MPNGSCCCVCESVLGEARHSCGAAGGMLALSAGPLLLEGETSSGEPEREEVPSCGHMERRRFRVLQGWEMRQSCRSAVACVY